MIDLYTAPTPNGWKVSMALEEMGLPYTPHVVNLAKGDQRTPEFLRMNPNGRIPVIVDRDTHITVFESGAILIYLAEKSGQLMPTDAKGRFDVLQWLMFQMAGIGPMQGQAVAFVRYFPETVQPAIDRYINETRRLYEVLNTRLTDREYLATDYSIADIANFSWLRSHRWARVPVDGLEHLQRWMATMASKPGIQRGCEVPPSRARPTSSNKAARRSRHASYRSICGSALGREWIQSLGCLRARSRSHRISPACSGRSPSAATPTRG